MVDVFHSILFPLGLWMTEEMERSLHILM